MALCNNVKIAYLGGGSRGWARTLMNDLACDGDISGTVMLYDIDYAASVDNQKIGNALSLRDDVPGKWQYVAVKKIDEALTGANVVIISVLPGTFDEMESDVHLPEKYGIYQSVGDTVGPGGIVRALRTVPMFEQFALAIKKHCPNAWVINFTNPMSICVGTLYKVFPQIKAFGCCHEVFGTQKLLADICNDKLGVKPSRDQISINVSGVNHFTWIDKAYYKDVDLFPLYAEFAQEHPEGIEIPDLNWANGAFLCSHKVKFDLFRRYGAIAAAGDRHLAEFCPGSWYLKDPETVRSYGFGLTAVSWRKADLKERYKKTEDLLNGKPFELRNSGEESVRQIKALLGINPYVTNVNLPNHGQAEGLAAGAIVETNAFFSNDSVRPMHAGKLPDGVNMLVAKVAYEQETVTVGALEGDYEKVFSAFAADSNVNLPLDKARELYNAMLYNTKSYLPHYDRYVKSCKK